MLFRPHHAVKITGQILVSCCLRSRSRPVLQSLRITNFWFKNREQELHLAVKPYKNGCRCPTCGRRGRIVHQTTDWRRWEDIAVMGLRVLLWYAPKEIRCPTHGRVQEEIPWAPANARITYRLEWRICALCQTMTQKAAAAILVLPTSTLSNLLHLQINTEKTKLLDLEKGESFSFLGFDFSCRRTRSGKWGVLQTPRAAARKRVLQRLREVFRVSRSQPVTTLIERINPVLQGWTTYFRRERGLLLSYVRNWVEQKVRRHLMRARGRHGFGWKRWRRAFLYDRLGLFQDYQVRYWNAPAARPTR